MEQSYLTTHWPPIVVLLSGILLIGFWGYLQLRLKASAAKWMAKHVFSDQLMALKSAENLLNVTTSFIGVIGGLWVILAIYYLSNG